MKLSHLLLFLFKHIYCDSTRTKFFNAVFKVDVNKKHYEKKPMLFALFVCVQSYFCAHSAICVCLVVSQCYFCAFSGNYLCTVHFYSTILFMLLCLELFSLNIFNFDKKPFMPQIGNLLACIYVFLILIWRILALYIRYSLVKANTVKVKIFQ